MNRIRIAWHLLWHDPLEALDYLTGCRIRWVCDRYEERLTRD